MKSLVVRGNSESGCGRFGATEVTVKFAGAKGGSCAAAARAEKRQHRMWRAGRVRVYFKC